MITERNFQLRRKLQLLEKENLYNDIEYQLILKYSTIKLCPVTTPLV